MVLGEGAGEETAAGRGGVGGDSVEGARGSTVPGAGEGRKGGGGDLGGGGENATYCTAMKVPTAGEMQLTVPAVAS